MKPNQKTRFCMPCRGISLLNLKTTPGHELDDPCLVQESIYKGYKVRVVYTKISEEEMRRKREAVAKIVIDAMRRRRFE